MAQRKFVTEDGAVFNTAGEAKHYEEVAPHLNWLVESGCEEGYAADIHAYYEANFRVPAKRTRKPKDEAAPAVEKKSKK